MPALCVQCHVSSWTNNGLLFFFLINSTGRLCWQCGSLRLVLVYLPLREEEKSTCNYCGSVCLNLSRQRYLRAWVNPRAVSLEPDRRHRDPFNLGGNAMTGSSDAPFIWNVLTSLHIPVGSLSSASSPLFLEVGGDVRHIRKESLK